MNLTDVNKHAESVEQFIRDVANAFREKRWVKILSLLGVVFALLLNPWGMDLLGFPRPRWYSYFVWGLVTGSFFVIAFVIALLTKQKETTDLPPQTSIIKGLLAYTNTKEDADWFVRLQRGNVLNDCLRFCLDTGSSFAILTGESGTGKTSFLQAGLSPSLEAQGQRAVCVKLTDSTPLELISRSLNSHNGDDVTTHPQTLLGMLREAIRKDARPTILILDQFEQFFTRNKSKPARRSFIEQMAEWHRSRDSLPVKILISVRDDFADQLSDFQKQMDYALTAHNKLRLEKFEPQEAAQVIAVIAREAKLELDETFVKELTRHELADREEGTVSPVDIQILSWMLDGQKTSEERAFNRRAFQKLGGVEGLLERFLSRQLDARDTETRRQTVIKVMLALTDQNVRAGALSLKALKEKLSGVVPEREVEETISWLTRSEVRLVTPVQEKDVTLYELAHERIISPLRRLAFKEISSVEKAQQTLDRRVNEWIGNNRPRRYLLTFREWRLIRRHWPLIRLESQKEQKEEFVALSKRRFMVTAASLAVVLVLGAGAYRVYAWYEARPQTQLHKAQKRLISLLNENKDRKAMEYATLLLAVLDSQKDHQLSQELWEQIKRRDDFARAKVLTRLSQAYLLLLRTDEAVKVLADAQREASALKPDNEYDFSSHSELVRSLAPNYLQLSKMSRTTEALKGLQGLQEMAQKSHPIWRIGMLQKVAKTYADFSQCYAASSVWDEAMQGLDKEDDAEGKSRRLKDWFEGYVELKERCGEPFAIKGLQDFNAEMARLPPEARQTLKEALSKIQDFSTKAINTKQADGRSQLFRLLRSADQLMSAKPDEAFRILEQVESATESLAPDERSFLLGQLSASYVELARTDEALRVLEKISLLTEHLPAEDQADVLFSLAGSYEELARNDKSLTILERVQRLADADPSPEKSAILWRLAVEYCELSMVDHALMLMEKANSIEKPDGNRLESFVNAVSKLSHPEEATKGLSRVRQLAATLPQDEQVELFLMMAQAYSKFKQLNEAGNSLVQAQKAANAKSSDEKSLVLAQIAAAYARLGKWQEAVVTAQSIGNEVQVISALVRILIISKEAKDSTEYMSAVEELFVDVQLGIP